MNNGARFTDVGYLGVVGAEPGSFVKKGTALWYINPDGNAIQVGTLPLFGQVTLVAGVKAINLPGVRAANNFAQVQLVVPNTAGSTIDYSAVITNDTLTITALVAAKTINAADVSTVNYFVN